MKLTPRLSRESKIGFPDTIQYPKLSVRKTHDGSGKRERHYLSMVVSDSETRFDVSFPVEAPRDLIDQLREGLEWLADQDDHS